MAPHALGPWPPQQGPATLQRCPGHMSWQQHLPGCVSQVRPATEAAVIPGEGTATPGLGRGSPHQAGEASAPAGRRDGGEGSSPNKTHRRREPDSVGAFYFKAAGFLGGGPFVSSLNIIKRDSTALYGRSSSVSRGSTTGPGRAELPTGGSGLLGALGPGSRAGWPASCLRGGVDSTPERQREGATVRLASREKQSTEGAGQGRRGVSLKERKRR